MPELPEVETVARQLDPLLAGRVIERLQVFDHRLDPGRPRGIRGRRVGRVFRAGKQVVIETAATGSVDRGPWLVCHLRMTGRLLWQEGRPRRPEHGRARLCVWQGAVDFVDPRRFGTLRWCRSEEEFAPPGLEPLDPGLSARRLGSSIAGSRQPIKIWLMRQDRLTGIGNIYASEILHEAGISPSRPAAGLDAAELRRLHRSVRTVLRRAIRHCGTTFSDFQGAQGVTGSYQQRLGVYGREGARCRRCRGGVIERVVQQQRSTFFCPECQR